MDLLSKIIVFYLICTLRPSVSKHAMLRAPNSGPVSANCHLSVQVIQNLTEERLLFSRSAYNGAGAAGQLMC